MGGCATQVQETTMSVSLPGDINPRRRGIGRSSRCDQVELPRLARPKGCCDICDIRSFGEQSGRTTGRLRSTDLRPCHRRDGTAGTPELLPQPGLGTNSDDYGPAATCRSMDLATTAGARATCMSRLWAGYAAGGRGPERRRATGPTTTRQSGSTGLGEQCKST
jgi:hypothetical protein